jgi:hypothetical protein
MDWLPHEMGKSMTVEIVDLAGIQMQIRLQVRYWHLGKMSTDALFSDDQAAGKSNDIVNIKGNFSVYNRAVFGL